MISFYKPNPRNTGSASSFSYKPKDGTFFVSFVKQYSWDAGRKIGSFTQNRNNPAASVNAKFGAHEIAGILVAIERGEPDFSTYHTSTNQTLQVNFGQYVKDGVVQSGYSLRITKDSNGQKTNFAMLLTLGEGRLLREYLVAALQEWSRKAFTYVPNQAPQESAPQQAEDQEEPALVGNETW